MIHIEGMGWLGAALAYRLAWQGTAFTWSDRDLETVAWRASTGCVYPAADQRTERNLRQWRSWMQAGIFPAGTVAEVEFVYAQKSPPHGSTAKPRIDLGWCRVAPETAVAVDVRSIVAQARQDFAAGRRDQPPAAARLIRAHGNTHRRAGWLWGWSAAVRLELPAELTSRLGHVPTFHSNAHRYRMAYAYAVPTRGGWWWAGSAMVRQSTPRRLDADAKLAQWLEDWRAIWPRIPVAEAEPPVHGWRPQPQPTDTGTLEADDTLPPLGHSGVRWAPDAIERAARSAA